MCLPIVRQTELLGLLYLEHRLIRGAFAPERLALLELLAAQAAISLHSAQLYNDLHASQPLCEAATPRAAISEARNRNVPVLLSRHIIAQTDFVPVAVEDLEFPRSYVLLTPAYGEPSGEVRPRTI